MLGILLSILKILGIILLAVLVFVLLAVLVLLFVPVRYRISGKWNTEEKRIEGKVTWLFRLVHISMSADKDEQQIVPRIMGINLKNRKKKKEKSKKREKKKRKKREKRKKRKENSLKEKNPEEKSKRKETEKKVEEQRKKEIQEDMDNSENTDCQQDDQREIKDVTQNLKKSIFQKIHEKIISVLSAIAKIAETWKKLLENIQELQQKKDKIFDFFCEKEALEAKDKTFKIVKKTIRHIRPQKLKTSVKFGAGNPAYTGQLYALLCLMYGIYGKDIILEPDFEHTILEGEFQLKGRIRLINLIYYVIYLYRIKKLREFIELLKNL
ncbi:MAG: DUF2953 domain-containing protein [Lachnospiraceae bacterium]|nr:DUF2953 domain-containing protein [Lachnospiraceae bacterium]